MPVPKKNHSKTRQNKRRANWKGLALNLATCKNCGAAHKSHTVCPECGFYNGRLYNKKQTQNTSA